MNTFSFKKQIEDYINEILLKSATFKLKEMKNIELIKTDDESINDKNYIEVFVNEEDKQTVIYHLILGMHGQKQGIIIINLHIIFLANNSTVTHYIINFLL